MNRPPSALPSFAEAVRVWARIGLLSVGGPAVQIALLHRVLVEEKGWLDERRFFRALAICMLLPGPEAHQLAVYTGWLLSGVRGGILAGTLFLLPGLLAVLALAFLYVRFGNLPLVQAALLGLRAVAIALVLKALVRIGRRLRRQPAMLGVAALAFSALFALQIPFPLVVLAAALVGGLAGRFAALPVDGTVAEPEPDPPTSARSAAARTVRLLLLGLVLWLAPLLLAGLLLGPEHTLTAIGRLASLLALFGFGGAYAVLAYAAEVVVARYAWLAPSEMLDGLALAEATPGPLLLVLSFVGFLASFRASDPLAPLFAGTLGGGLAAWGLFLPSSLFVLLSAPFAERLRRHAALSAALAAIDAAAWGAIGVLALRFAFYGLFLVVEPIRLGPFVLELPLIGSVNPVGSLLAALACVAVFRFRLPLGPLLLGGAAAGVALYLLRFGLLGFL